LIRGFFESQIKKQDILIRELPDDIDISHVSAHSAHEIDTLEETLKSNEDRLSNLIESKELLEKRHAELIELRHVLRETAQFFEIVDPFLGIADDRPKGDPMKFGGVWMQTHRFSSTLRKKVERMSRQRLIDHRWMSGTSQASFHEQRPLSLKRSSGEPCGEISSYVPLY
jgi:hypothetical protein